MDIPAGVNLTAEEEGLLKESHRAISADPLDAERLGDLGHRLRKAKDKYTGLFRRQAAARVQVDKARGEAADSNLRTEAKAEVFAAALDEVETAIDRAHRQEEQAAAHAHDELAAERIAAARAVHANHGPGSQPPEDTGQIPPEAQIPPEIRDTKSGARRGAIRAAGAHNQAAKDQG
jgi:hypothetical protein